MKFGGYCPRPLSEYETCVPMSPQKNKNSIQVIKRTAYFYVAIAEEHCITV